MFDNRCLLTALVSLIFTLCQHPFLSEDQPAGLGLPWFFYVGLPVPKGWNQVAEMRTQTLLNESLFGGINGFLMTRAGWTVRMFLEISDVHSGSLEELQETRTGS